MQAITQAIPQATTVDSPHDQPTGSTVGVRILDTDIPLSPGPDEVLVKFLAAPIHPLDLLVIRGSYPVEPKYHLNGEAILGYDGVGQILSCGSEVLASGKLRPEDLVVPQEFGIGTWRSHGVIRASMLLKLSKAPDDIMAASILRLVVGPAYCLVEDMRELRPGDCIIQNAGTSTIARFVTQFARMRGVDVIHVIRDRGGEDVRQIRSDLLELGANAVLTESELARDAKSLRSSRHIVLAIDSVFGKSGGMLLQTLADGGDYVQMGFLGGREGGLALNSGDLFARRLTLRGFRGSAQMALRTAEEQARLFDWWINLFNSGLLKIPTLALSPIRWGTGGKTEDMLEAIRRAGAGAVGQRKQIFIF